MLYPVTIILKIRQLKQKQAFTVTSDIYRHQSKKEFFYEKNKHLRYWS